MAKTRLNLGSGHDYVPGMINIDNHSQGFFKADRDADIRTLKWKDNSVDEILLSHVALYLSLEELPKLLKRWRGWLKKGGKFYLETGNLLALCKMILEAKNIKEINGSNGVAQIFGHEYGGTNLFAKWCWSPETMVHIFNVAGFSKIEIGPGYFHNNPERDFLIIGTK